MIVYVFWVDGGPLSLPLLSIDSSSPCPARPTRLPSLPRPHPLPTSRRDPALAIPFRQRVSLSLRPGSCFSPGVRFDEAAFVSFSIFRWDFLGGFSRVFSTWDSKGAKDCKSCRSRKMLSNEYLVAKFGFDTEENEPLKVWGVIQFIIQSSP